MNQIIARRVGRIVFGGVLLVGLAYLVGAGCSSRSPRSDSWVFADALPFHADWILGLTWALASVAGVVAWRVAALVPFAGVRDRWFAASFVMPAIGMAMLLPITLHLPVFLLLADSAAFDSWVLTSMAVTGAAHIVFASMSGMRAHQLVAGEPAFSPREICGATWLTSCVPFVVFFAFPPTLVALTSLPLVPLLRGMERLVARERDQVERASWPLPRAIVRPRPSP